MKLLIFTCLTMGWFQSAWATNGVAPIHVTGPLSNERGVFNWNPSYTVNLPAFDRTNHAFFGGRIQNANDVPPLELEHFNSSGLTKHSYEAALLRHFPAGTVIQSTLGANGRRYTSGVFPQTNTSLSSASW